VDRPPDDALLVNLPPFLQLLRSVSKQSTLPTGCVAALNTRIDALPDIDFPNQTSPLSAIRGDILDSALTMRVVQITATRPIDSVPQVHDILLLDAIAAANSGDLPNWYSLRCNLGRVSCKYIAASRTPASFLTRTTS